MPPWGINVSGAVCRLYAGDVSNSANSRGESHDYAHLSECKHQQIQRPAFGRRAFTSTAAVTSHNGHNKELSCYITARRQICTVLNQTGSVETNRRASVQTNKQTSQNQERSHFHSDRHTSNTSSHAATGRKPQETTRTQFPAAGEQD